MSVNSLQYERSIRNAQLPYEIINKQNKRNIIEKTYDTSDKHNDVDRIYFNVTIPHSMENQTATYNQSLNQTIIDSPEDFFISIIRFQIPTNSIPIFIAEIQPYPNTNLNNTVYSVTLQYNGFSSRETFIQYISYGPDDQQSLPLTPSHPYADKTEYYFIYDYQHFITLINNALQTAFTTLSGLVTMPIGSVAPYLIYDTIRERISIIAQQPFYDLNHNPPLLLPITMFVNTKLFNYLEGIPVIYYAKAINGLDNKILIENTQNNEFIAAFTDPTLPGYIPLIQMESEYQTLVLWNAFKSLQIVSPTLPIIQEYIPVTNQSSGLVKPIVSTSAVLKDFIPLVILGPESRTSCEYEPTGPYSLINMTGKRPIINITIQLYWTDQYGTQYPIFIPFAQVATIKLVFIRKSTYVG
jgi:hypothetical protein